MYFTYYTEVVSAMEEPTCRRCGLPVPEKGQRKLVSWRSGYPVQRNGYHGYRQHCDSGQGHTFPQLLFLALACPLLAGDFGEAGDAREGDFCGGERCGHAGSEGWGREAGTFGGMVDVGYSMSPYSTCDSHVM